ncbi:heptaprenyl diphosphate synthase component I [Anaerotignum neopropionicum]|uniref:Heptaprenyl diphosphate synthase component I n=1 Tax=Anaerotignum neopropionicum TaxID=36847 RepID=A0A136WI04_9FIRM|nr:Gx transporter family protein [Anaerotignum neopropionicum]KXL54107.1 heptaprenyl diphosphate synthase component I [Anaerotignum neopropionicum]
MHRKNVAYYGLFAALAILMGYVEMLIPIPLLVPGMKLGLANVIIVIVLYFMDTRAAFFISLVRVLLSGLLFAGFAGLLYSLAGALFSFCIMVLLKKTDKFSILGVSVAGGVFHNIGQIIVAALVVENIRLMYYLPFLLFFGVLTGAVIGIVARMTLGYLKRHFS